jgi:hypothetical protein
MPFTDLVGFTPVAATPASSEYAGRGDAGVSRP